MKLAISVSIVVVGSLGDWLGSLLDKGSLFGGWSLMLGFVGALAGIWVGYKVGQYFSA